MIEAAVEESAKGAAEFGHEAPRVIAVTVLSSVGGDSLASPASLAFEAVATGAAGVVVSGEEVRTVREVLGEEPVVVTPGVRPSGGAPNDHVRILTPGEAIESGADYIVVGRPVTEAKDPAAAARLILNEVGIERH